MNLENTLYELCNDLIHIELREKELFHCIRNDPALVRNEDRYELACEVADLAREILYRMKGEDDY